MSVIETVLLQYWAIIVDGGPALKQHWVNVSMYIHFLKDITCNVSLVKNNKQIIIVIMLNAFNTSPQLSLFIVSILIIQTICL